MKKFALAALVFMVLAGCASGPRFNVYTAKVPVFDHKAILIQPMGVYHAIGVAKDGAVIVNALPDEEWA